MLGQAKTPNQDPACKVGFYENEDENEEGGEGGGDHKGNNQSNDC